MMQLLSYPVRVSPDGAALHTTTEGTMAYYMQEVVILIRTEVGERPLVPEYGMTDPTFGTFDNIALGEKVGVFGPPVEIIDVIFEPINQDTYRAVVEMELPVEEQFGYDDSDSFEVDAPAEETDY